MADGLPDPADHDQLVPMVKKSMGHRAQGLKPHTRLDKKFSSVKSGVKGPMADTLSNLRKG